MQHVRISKTTTFDDIDLRLVLTDHIIDIVQTTSGEYVNEKAEYDVLVRTKDDKTVMSFNTGNDNVTIEQALACVFLRIVGCTDININVVEG